MNLSFGWICYSWSCFCSCCCLTQNVCGQNFFSNWRLFLIPKFCFTKNFWDAIFFKLKMFLDQSNIKPIFYLISYTPNSLTRKYFGHNNFLDQNLFWNEVPGCANFINGKFVGEIMSTFEKYEWNWLTVFAAPSYSIKILKIIQIKTN